MMSKLTVVVDAEGRVLATHPGHGEVTDPDTGIRVELTAGPRQVLHKIDFEIPALKSRKDIEAFHRAAGAALSFLPPVATTGSLTATSTRWRAFACGSASGVGDNVEDLDGVCRVIAFDHQLAAFGIAARLVLNDHT
jgi:hypothetical protein